LSRTFHLFNKAANEKLTGGAGLIATSGSAPCCAVPLGRIFDDFNAFLSSIFLNQVMVSDSSSGIQQNKETTAARITFTNHFQSINILLGVGDITLDFGFDTGMKNSTGIEENLA
jgi:hypothetical protein